MDVLEDSESFKAGTSEVDYLDVWALFPISNRFRTDESLRFQEDIFWLEITVNELPILDNFQSVKDLRDDQAGEV